MNRVEIITRLFEAHDLITRCQYFDAVKVILQLADDINDKGVTDGYPTNI